MPFSESAMTGIDEISARIAALQTALLSVEAQLKTQQDQAAGQSAKAALAVIDLLDLMDRVGADTAEDNTSSPVILKKIDQRLRVMLRSWQVEEIHLAPNQVEIGRTRVLETRASREGLRVEICRKGYQRGTKILRPVDVIVHQPPGEDE
jgi:molecular chaperone GrpE (heat shock protein)